ncbi:hypothetical protein Dcar01_02580 [Deinococcus carri]|uniref:Ig-like domain-containing protein n=1 Tax=Deinococcus carri TaxID=1211323 RepID=A0ABP9WC85_9DEIO
MRVFEQQFPSEIESVLALLEACASQPDRLELWLSESREVRARLQADLRHRFPGCELRVHAAYKPLACEVFEVHLPLWQAAPPRHVHLRFPVLDGEHPERFLIEAYPLAGWLDDLRVRFTHEGYAADHYELVVDGELTRVEVPLRGATDALGRPCLRPTARVDIVQGEGATTRLVLTDAERCWDAYTAFLKRFPWPQQAPFFGVLRVAAELSEPDEPLAYGHERASLTEGLSEDLYFGTLEYFQDRAGVPLGSRELPVGQIVPVVKAVPGGPCRLTVDLLPLPQAAASSGAAPPLATLDRPLRVAEVYHLTREWPDPPTFHSVQGRPIPTLRRPGRGSGVLISGGQHGNEATGVAAALLAAGQLASPLPLGFIPLENPDGAALFEELRAVAPEHMHHAARYTALGDDLEYRQPPFGEADARCALARELNAALHVNLHGYPAHEWTRPFSGYVPRGFEAWSLPKGFVLLVRHTPEQSEQARRLAEQVCLDLSGQRALMAFNERQLRVYECHTAARPYQMIHGTPVMLAEVEGMLCPLTLLTEFPDETVEGERFRLGCTAQGQVIESAVRWLEGEALSSPRPAVGDGRK